MPDPEMVARAHRAAAMLERAWDRWRTAYGIATGPMPPISSYVGYSIEEPWGRPRVVFGVDAREAEQLAVLLDNCTPASAACLEEGVLADDPGSLLEFRPGEDPGAMRAHIPVQARPAQARAAEGMTVTEQARSRRARRAQQPPQREEQPPREEQTSGREPAAQEGRAAPQAAAEDEAAEAAAQDEPTQAVREAQDEATRAEDSAEAWDDAPFTGTGEDLGMEELPGFRTSSAAEEPHRAGSWAEEEEEPGAPAAPWDSGHSQPGHSEPGHSGPSGPGGPGYATAEHAGWAAGELPGQASARAQRCGARSAHPPPPAPEPG